MLFTHTYLRAHSNSTQFADSPHARGTHTLFQNLIRLDDFHLEGLRHARFNQPISEFRTRPGTFGPQGRSHDHDLNARIEPCGRGVQIPADSLSRPPDAH